MFCFKLIICLSIFGITAAISMERLKESANTYILTDEKVSFDQGKRMCQAHGKMFPLSIESREKHLEVISFLASYNISSVWTSGNDLEYRGLYRWTASDRVFTYTKWLIGAPLEDDRCRCVSIVSGFHTACGPFQSCAGWIVEPCSSPRQVICEVRQ